MLWCSPSPNDKAKDGNFTAKKKNGRERASSERRRLMEKEMDVLNALVTEDKSSIS